MCCLFCRQCPALESVKPRPQAVCGSLRGLTVGGNLLEAQPLSFPKSTLPPSGCDRLSGISCTIVAHQTISLSASATLTVVAQKNISYGQYPFLRPSVVLLVSWL